MKTVKTAVIVVAVLILAFVGIVMVSAKNVVRHAVQGAIDGFDLKIGSLRASLIRPYVEIRNLTLENPCDFSDRDALNVKQLRIRYDLRSLFSDTIHLKEVTIDISKAVEVIKEDGESNLSRLTNAGQKKEELPSKQGAAEAKPAKKTRQVHIDVLHLKIGNIEIHHYSSDQPTPKITKYAANLNQTYYGVTNTPQIAVLIGVDLLSMSINNVLEGHQGDIDKANKDINDTAKKLEKKLKSFLNSGK